MKPLYRADHVGSLLRPKQLLAARNDPRITREQLTALEDRTSSTVLERQRPPASRSLPTVSCAAPDS